MDNHFGLLVDTDYSGDVTGANWNRVTKTVRRALGELLQKIVGPGCLTTSDWRIDTDKTIGAGEGVVKDCYCETTEDTDISSLLTNGATNYIYLTIDSDTSPTDGDVVAQASLSTTVPSGACRLGSITLDGAGAVTAVDNDDEDYLRDYLLTLNRRRVQFDEVVTVALGDYADLEVDHSADVTFTEAFVPKITSIDEGVRAELLLEGTTNGKFTLRLYNDGSYTAGYGYEYGYGGLDEVRVQGERWGI